MKILVDGLDHPEGIALDGDGQLVCGSESGDVTRIDPHTGEVTLLAATRGNLLGLTQADDGGILACDMRTKSVLRVDPDSGSYCMLAFGLIRVPNACIVEEDGSLLVTDSGSCWEKGDGHIVRVFTDGSVEVLASDLAFPNGIDRDGDQVLVVETSPPALTRYQYAGPGHPLGEREVVIEFDSAFVPDGVHAAGGRWFVSLYRPDGIVDVASGDMTWVARDPRGRFLSGPSNVVWIPSLSALAVANTCGTWVTLISEEEFGA